MPSTTSRRAFLASVGAGGVAALVPQRTRSASQRSIVWSRTYPSENGHLGILVRDVVETPHGFVLGGVETVGSGSVGWLAGVDDAGRRRWERRLGHPTSWFYQGTSGSENRVFLAGVRNDHQGVTEDGYPDPWLVALEDRRDGPVIQWDRTFQPAAPGGTARAIVPVGDGLALAGSISESEAAGPRPWVGAVDPNGTLQWEWEWEWDDAESAGDGSLNAAVPVESGVVVGGSRGVESGFERAWIGWLSNDGALVRSVTVDEKPGSRIEALARRPSGGVVAVGVRGFSSDDHGVGFLAGIDPDGTRRWVREYPAGDWNWLRDVCSATPGYYLLGTREVTDGNRRGAWVVRVDAEGRKQWDRLYPADEYVRGFALHRLGDESVLVGGDLSSGDVRGHGWLAQVGGTAPEGLDSGSGWLSVPSLPSVPDWSVPLAAGLGLGVGIERLRRRR